MVGKKKKIKKKIIAESQLETVDVLNDEENITPEDLEGEVPEPKEKKGKKQKVLKSGLNLREEEFCRTYVSHDRDLYGNGVKCYLEVYGPDYMLTNKRYLSYKVAAVLATRLLKKVNIITRINDLLEEGGFNDINVDKQHLFLINQHADLKSKLGAIKEYNTLKKRVEQAGLVVNIIEAERKEINSALKNYIHGNRGNTTK